MLDFDASAAAHFGKLGAALARRGVPIGPLDTMIAAHAQALGRVLVTNDTRHFSRVPGVALENWRQSVSATSVPARQRQFEARLGAAALAASLLHG